MDSRTLAAIQQLISLIKVAEVNKTVDINPASANYTAPGGGAFRLYVGVSGVIVGKDNNGTDFTRTYTAGYHPMPVSQVNNAAGGTTATSVVALFP